MLTELNISSLHALVLAEKSDSWSLMYSLNVSLLPVKHMVFALPPQKECGVCVNALYEDSLELWVVQFRCWKFEGGVYINVCHILLTAIHKVGWEEGVVFFQVRRYVYDVLSDCSHGALYGIPLAWWLAHTPLHPFFWLVSLKVQISADIISSAFALLLN